MYARRNSSTALIAVLMAAVMVCTVFVPMIGSFEDSSDAEPAGPEYPNYPVFQDIMDDVDLEPFMKMLFKGTAFEGSLDNIDYDALKDTLSNGDLSGFDPGMIMTGNGFDADRLFGKSFTEMTLADLLGDELTDQIVEDYASELGLSEAELRTLLEDVPMAEILSNLDSSKLVQSIIFDHPDGMYIGFDFDGNLVIIMDSIPLEPEQGEEVFAEAVRITLPTATSGRTIFGFHADMIRLADFGETYVDIEFSVKEGESSVNIDILNDVFNICYDESSSGIRYVFDVISFDVFHDGSSLVIQNLDIHKEEDSDPEISVEHFIIAGVDYQAFVNLIFNDEDVEEVFQPNDFILGEVELRGIDIFINRTDGVSTFELIIDHIRFGDMEIEKFEALIYHDEEKTLFGIELASMAVGGRDIIKPLSSEDPGLVVIMEVKETFEIDISIGTMALGDFVIEDLDFEFTYSDSFGLEDNLRLGLTIGSVTFQNGESTATMGNILFYTDYTDERLSFHCGLQSASYEDDREKTLVGGKYQFGISLYNYLGEGSYLDFRYPPVYSYDKYDRVSEYDSGIGLVLRHNVFDGDSTNSVTLISTEPMEDITGYPDEHIIQHLFAVQYTDGHEPKLELRFREIDMKYLETTDVYRNLVIDIIEGETQRSIGFTCDGTFGPFRFTDFVLDITIYEDGSEADVTLDGQLVIDLNLGDYKIHIDVIGDNDEGHQNLSIQMTVVNEVEKCSASASFRNGTGDDVDKYYLELEADGPFFDGSIIADALRLSAVIEDKKVSGTATFNGLTIHNVSDDDPLPGWFKTEFSKTTMTFSIEDGEEAFELRTDFARIDFDEYDLELTGAVMDDVITADTLRISNNSYDLVFNEVEYKGELAGYDFMATSYSGTVGGVDITAATVPQIVSGDYPSGLFVVSDKAKVYKVNEDQVLPPEYDFAFVIKAPTKVHYLDKPYFVVPGTVLDFAGVPYIVKVDGSPDLLSSGTYSPAVGAIVTVVGVDTSSDVTITVDKELQIRKDAVDSLPADRKLSVKNGEGVVVDMPVSALKLILGNKESVEMFVESYVIDDSPMEETIIGHNYSSADREALEKSIFVSIDFEGAAQLKDLGTVTVTVPFDLKGSDPEDITVYYYNSSTHRLEEVTGTYFEVAGQGYVSFETTHFSGYIIGEKINGTSDGNFALLEVIAIVFALIVVAVIYLLVTECDRRKA